MATRRRTEAPGATGSIAWAESPDLRRKQFLDLVRRRVRPGSGSAIEFLRTRTWSEPDVDLHRVRTPFVIVGTVATWLYMPQRTTKGTNVLVRTRDAPSFHRELTEAGAARLGRLSFGGTRWQLAGVPLKVLESSEPWTEGAVHSPNRSPSGLPVISLPYLVLLKLRASRSVDIADLTRMLGLADEDAGEQVRNVVRRYKPDALEDIESMIVLGALELRTPDRHHEG